MSPRKTTDGRKPNGKWVDRWRDPDGTHRQRTFDRKGDRDAFRALRLRMQQLGPAAAEVLFTEDVTLAEFVETWWEEHALVELEASTRESYKHVWAKHLLPRVGSYGLREIDTTVVLDLRQRMLRAGVGEPTVYRALSILQSVLSHAVLRKRLAVNPVSLVRKPPQRPGREAAPIPPIQVERLRARLGARDALLVSVLAYEGLRPEEALALDVADIGKGRIRVHRKNVDGQLRPYTKTRTNRSVDLLAPVAQDIAAYQLATGLRDGLLFPMASGAPWRKHDFDNWRRRVWQPAAAAVGLGRIVEDAGRRGYEGAPPYALRAAFVSLLAWEGRTMLEVARQAGHSLQTCDRHYAGIFDEAPAHERVPADVAIRQAREQLAAGPLGTEAREQS